jgi:hypothetical protein
MRAGRAVRTPQESSMGLHDRQSFFSDLAYYAAPEAVVDLFSRSVSVFGGFIPNKAGEI